MVRYRNIQRNSSAAKQQKLKGFKLAPLAAKPTENMDELWEETETMKESVKALQDLFNGRVSVPSATVQTLLDKTRPLRNVWLQGAVSIHTILKEYPPPRVPKWVRMHKSGLLTIAFHINILL